MVLVILSEEIGFKQKAYAGCRGGKTHSNVFLVSVKISIILLEEKLSICIKSLNDILDLIITKPNPF